MRKVNIHEAKTHLSQLVEAAAGGERIVLARAGKPVAMLVPLPLREPRRSGLLAGRIHIGADFDAPLPQTIVEAFEGNS